MSPFIGKQFKLDKISGFCPFCGRRVTFEKFELKKMHFICPYCKVEYFFRWDLRCLQFILPRKAKELLKKIRKEKLEKRKKKKEKK